MGVVGIGTILALPPAVKADPVIEAMQDYMMFQEYAAGIILQQQLDQLMFDAALFIDTRSEGQFAAGTIPGAINIEWRAVLQTGIDGWRQTGAYHPSR